MARTKVINNSIKYTVMIPESDIELLKELANQKQIDSVNAGIREAVEEYIVRLKKEQYKRELLKAVEDEDFIKRTKDADQGFRKSDEEAEEMIPEW